MEWYAYRSIYAGLRLPFGQVVNYEIRRIVTIGFAKLQVSPLRLDQVSCFFENTEPDKELLFIENCEKNGRKQARNTQIRKAAKKEKPRKRSVFKAFMSMGYKKDTFGSFAYEFELS